MSSKNHYVITSLIVIVASVATPTNARQVLSFIISVLIAIMLHMSCEELLRFWTIENSIRISVNAIQYVVAIAAMFLAGAILENRFAGHSIWESFRTELSEIVKLVVAIYIVKHFGIRRLD